MKNSLDQQMIDQKRINLHNNKYGEVVVGPSGNNR